MITAQIVAEGRGMLFRLTTGEWKESSVRKVKFSDGDEIIEHYNVDFSSWCEVPERLRGKASKSLRSVPPRDV